MIKNNPIIKSTLIIYLSIYSGITIWELFHKETLVDLATSLYGVAIFIVGCAGLGFALTVLISTLAKKLLLDKLYKKKSNGRYSITTGDLPIGVPIEYDSIDPKVELSEPINNWINNNESLPNYVALFLHVCKILKHRPDVLAELDTTISVFTQSKLITNEICKLQTKSKEEIYGVLKSSYFTKYNMPLDDLLKALESPLMPIIGICHDIGKLNASSEPGQEKYLLDYGKKGRDILTKIEYTWQLSQNDIDDLFLVTSYSMEYDNSPKVLLDGHLAYRSVHATCLTAILLYCQVQCHQNVEESLITAPKSIIEPRSELPTVVQEIAVAEPIQILELAAIDDPEIELEPIKHEEIPLSEIFPDEETELLTLTDEANKYEDVHLSNVEIQQASNITVSQPPEIKDTEIEKEKISDIQLAAPIAKPRLKFTKLKYVK